MEEFPSGQREQTVNLPSTTSVVRIHPLPPEKSTSKEVLFSMKFAFRRVKSLCDEICSAYEIFTPQMLMVNFFSYFLQGKYFIQNLFLDFIVSIANVFIKNKKNHHSYRKVFPFPKKHFPLDNTRT